MTEPNIPATPTSSAPAISEEMERQYRDIDLGSRVVDHMSGNKSVTLCAREIVQLQRMVDTARCLLADNQLLKNRVIALEQDRRLLEWLVSHFVAADFAYPCGKKDGETICALIIEIPRSTRVGADLRAAVDAARERE